MINRFKNIYLTLGVLTLAASLILKRFVGDYGINAFLVGMLTGMSIVFNITFLVYWRKMKQARKET
jgi:hypothetical protein